MRTIGVKLGKMLGAPGHCIGAREWAGNGVGLIKKMNMIFVVIL